MRSNLPTHRTAHKITAVLSREFPISRMLVVKRILPWLAGFVLLGCLLTAVSLKLNSTFESAVLPPAVSGALVFLASAALVACICKLIFEALSRVCYYYAIEGTNLVISKGILIKQRGSFPLSRITDVYLNRSFYDFIFGLYNLNVSTPTIHSGEFAEINGLSKTVALGLQNFLTQTLEAAGQRRTPDYMEHVARYNELELPAIDHPLPLPLPAANLD